MSMARIEEKKLDLAMSKEQTRRAEIESWATENVAVVRGIKVAAKALTIIFCFIISCEMHSNYCKSRYERGKILKELDSLMFVMEKEKDTVVETKVIFQQEEKVYIPLRFGVVPEPKAQEE